MKNILIACCGTLIFLFNTEKSHAQTTLILDTTVADGYLSIIGPTYNNFIKIMQADDKQFNDAMHRYKYEADEDGGEGSFKIESFQATYTISKSSNNVELYFSAMDGFLKQFQDEIKKHFPTGKNMDAGADNTYNFETSDVSGKHNYMLTINTSNNSKVFISIMLLN